MRDTATLFNENLTGRARATGDDLPEPPIRDIVVVGGGTAGWMTALLLADSKYGERLRVTVLESPSVGIIGVGEGSTPWLRGFFDGLGIEESEWMPACNATYKSGITFDGWSTRPGFESYFHPFASMLDNLTMPQFVHNVHARLNNADVHAHPDRFFIVAQGRRGAARAQAAARLSVRHLVRLPLRLVAARRVPAREGAERGVHHVARHMTSVTLDERGDIRVAGARRRRHAGGRLLRRLHRLRLAADRQGAADALRVVRRQPVQRRRHRDALAARRGRCMSQTVSTALRHGWAWKIPLTSRYGNGYVYSSAHCSADAAETELRTHLGLLDADVPARHLKMRIGR